MNSFSGGGAQKVCLNIAKRLYELNVESEFIILYSSEPDYEIPEYISIFSLGIEESDSIIRKIFHIIKWRFKVNRYILDKEYILITAHLPMSHILASLTKIKRRCLYVMHGSQHLIDKYFSKCYGIGLRLFLSGKKIVTVSEELEKELKIEYGIPSKNITTVYNPSPLKTIKSENKYAFPHLKPYILVMGRLEEEKKPLKALEIYYKGNFYDNYDLIYLGKGTLEKKLRKQIAKYNLEKNVFLVGFQKEPERWLKNAALLLSCSNQEGCPMCLIEALICGTPAVFANDACGTKEILVGELEKYLINPEEDIDKSISVILSALENYPVITEKYYAKFDDALIVKQYMEVWKDNFGEK